MDIHNNNNNKINKLMDSSTHETKMERMKENDKTVTRSRSGKRMKSKSQHHERNTNKTKWKTSCRQTENQLWAIEIQCTRDRERRKKTKTAATNTHTQSIHSEPVLKMHPRQQIIAKNGRIYSTKTTEYDVSALAGLCIFQM